MVGRLKLIGTLFLLAVLAHPAAAYAAAGDPDAGSPAGSVYELPLEAARGDAAPVGGGTGAREARGGAGEDSSFYRSENNFGSSSQVPGAPQDDGGLRQAHGRGDGAEPSISAPGEGVGPLAAGAAGEAGSAAVPDTGNTSVAANVGLLATIVLLAGGVGLFAARRRLRLR